MQGRRLLINTIIAGIACVIFAGSLYAAQTVSGTLQSWVNDTITIKSDTTGKIVPIKPESDAVILRGQTGREMKKAALLDFAPGDRVVAVVKQNGQASSLKAYYTVVRGTIKKAGSDKLLLNDGSSVVLRPGLQVISGDGKMLKPENMQLGSLVLCRLNPTTKEAWTVVVTQSQTAKTQAATTSTPEAAKPVEKPKATEKQEPVEPAKVTIELNKVPPVTPAGEDAKNKTALDIDVEIKSIEMTGPWPLKVRDWFRVDMEGTPSCKAACYVKGLIPVTEMTEIFPGKYRASIMVPSGKPVKDAALIGKLTVGDVSAVPVQASKLITVGIPEPEPPVIEQKPEQPAEPAPAPEPEPEPVQPSPAEATPVPEPPKEKAPVVISSPADNVKIYRAITVTGTAEPGSKVMVEIEYTNGLGGILNLSGQVSSQLIAVNDDGQFSMGPVPLEGPLATKGLQFTIDAFYPEAADVITEIRVIGDRD